MGPHNAFRNMALTRAVAKACIELPDRFRIAQGKLGECAIRAHLLEDLP
jgi:hypothetical protein